jgi:hypothetical protein
VSKQVDIANLILVGEQIKDLHNHVLCRLEHLAPQGMCLELGITDHFILDVRGKGQNFLLCVYTNEWHVFPTTKTLDVIKLEEL